jgi:predicted amidohydrolase YtcJ
MKRTLIYLLLCPIFLMMTARAGNAATVYLYHGGFIYVKAGAPPVEAVVVQDGKFSYVGGLEGALQAAGQDCERVDLQGRTMLPSFFDAHAHPNMASLLDLRDLPYAGDVPTPEEYVEHVRQYLEAHPDTQALRGTGWDNAVFPEAPPNKALLDQVSAEIPIFLRSFDQHSAWVNSKALEMSGVTRGIFAQSAPPGQIERDETGEPCGTLRDEITITVDSALPPVTVEEHKELILKFQDMAHGLGITGCMCAMVLPRDNHYTAYRELLAEGKLSMYTRLAFLITPETYADAIEWAANEAAAYEAANGVNDLLGFRLAKFFMDGAILGQTAYLSEDYAARPGFRGEPSWPADAAALRDAFRLCEEKGLRIHVHAIGDAATRLALGGLEIIKTPNRHAITHLELVEPDDLARLSAMGVMATINPYWFCKSAVWAESELKQLGFDRSERMLPAKSFYDAGVKVAAASDYPVSNPNPLIGMEMAVTRTLIAPWRGGRTAEECTLNFPEAVSMEQALDAFTLTAAYAYDLDSLTGSIEAGKSADFVLLDKNIIQAVPSEAKVLETWFRGEKVYDATHAK